MNNLIIEALEQFDHEVEKFDISKYCVKKENHERFKMMHLTRIYIKVIKELLYIFTAHSEWPKEEFQDALMILFVHFNDKMDELTKRDINYYETAINNILEELENEV